MLLRKIISNQYVQIWLFGLVSLFFILAGVERDKNIIALAPFFIIAATLVIFNPSVVLFLFIGSFYIGDPLVYRSMLLLDSADLTLLLLAAALISVLFTASRPSLTFGTTDKKIVYALIMLIFVSLLSILLNLPSKKTPDIATSFWYVINTVELILGYLIFSRSFMLNKKELFINVALVLSIIEIILASYQFLNFNQSDLEKLRDIRGTFVLHHAMLGNMMVLAMAFFLYRLTATVSQLHRIAYFSGAVGSLFAITISSSRSVLLGVFGAGCIWLLATFKISRKYLLSLVVILTVIGGILLFTPLRPLLLNTFRNNQTMTLDMSSYERILIWQGALQNFAQAPLPQKIFGIGIGNYYTMQYSARLIEGTKNALGAHNNLLHVLTETGIVGLLVFGTLFTIILVNLRRRSKSDKLCYIYFYATIALLISGITQETFWFQPAFSRFWLYYMVFLGCCLGGRGEQETIGYRL